MHENNPEPERRSAQQGLPPDRGAGKDRTHPSRSRGADRPRERAAPGAARRIAEEVAADSPAPLRYRVILADTSVWVDHFRRSNTRLGQLLVDGEVLCHPFVVGELACGFLTGRAE